MKNKQIAKVLAQALDRACQQKSAKQIDLILVNFERLLLERRWRQYLADTIKELKTIENFRQNIIQVKLSSAHELDAQEKKQLSDIVARLSGKKVTLQTSLEPDLIGGAILSYDDKVLDLSLKNKLANLTEHLVS